MPRPTAALAPSAAFPARWKPRPIASANGHGALVGQPGERLGGSHRLELMHGGGRGELGDLDRQHPVRPSASADGEDLLEMLDRLGRTHRGESVLQLLDADRLREVAAHQAQTDRRRPGRPARCTARSPALRRGWRPRVGGGPGDPPRSPAAVAGPRTSARRERRLRSPDRASRRGPRARARRPPRRSPRSGVGSRAAVAGGRDAGSPARAPSRARRRRPPRGRSSSPGACARAPRGRPPPGSGCRR